ncbi:excalibur calcium-binding domain-containing protein [Erythrobacter rubeus]|nr:excalibur calcium-binding domain-containing protein [Erythrobacter rubeus]
MKSRGEARTSWIEKAEFAFLLIVQVAMLISALAFLASSAASAHPGRTAADGCHNDRKNGGRHCHGAPMTSKPTRTPSGEVYYPNCAAARAAGATPVHRGQPGYGRHLDRDNDGIGCER